MREDIAAKTCSMGRLSFRLMLPLLLAIAVAFVTVMGLTACSGKEPYIPEGFSHAEGDLKSGYTIGSTSNDMFVWIPVKDFARYDFDKDAAVDGDDPIGRIYHGEGRKESVIYGGDYDIEGFRSSVEKYGGFYISRFEIGDGKAKAPRTDDSSVDPEQAVPVSRSGAYPYNFVTRDEALKICNSFINDPELKSTLASSYAWDMTMQYIGRENWGADPTQPPSDGTAPEKTGKGDVIKGIADLEGNVSEWTTEYSSNAYYDYHDDCVMRGNNFSDREGSPVSRNCNSNVRNEFTGFRMVLYRVK